MQNKKRIKSWSHLVMAMMVSVAMTGQASFAYAGSEKNDPRGGIRIKDIVNVEGIRDNLLMGYGLVVGLNGTGDNLSNSIFTKEELVDLLERLGVNTKGEQLKTRNVAAVTVTASLPPFARHGSRIDVTVSTLGDSKSLEGGVLIATPLLGADGEVYALAQGQVTIGGFSASGKTGSSVSKGVPTSGFLPNGAIIEKEMEFSINDAEKLSLALKNPDISTSHSIANAINGKVGEQVAMATDPGTVELLVPASYKHQVMDLLGTVESLRVTTDQPARIVVDESSGTIVMGENVRIDTVAIAQGNLTVRINEAPYISQPGAFAPDSAQTAQVERTFIEVAEGDESRMSILEDGATLGDLVAGLNALGVGPRDLITILETIKAAGALQAEIMTK